jgi:hypothetical protein
MTRLGLQAPHGGDSGVAARASDAEPSPQLVQRRLGLFAAEAHGRSSMANMPST